MFITEIRNFKNRILIVLFWNSNVSLDMNTNINNIITVSLFVELWGLRSDLRTFFIDFVVIIINVVNFSGKSVIIILEKEFW